jgi:uncharacterized membrane protein
MTRIQWIMAAGVTALTIGFTGAVYPWLPERIPTHWNAAGEVDGWGSKPWAFLTPAILIGLLGLLRLLPWLSPRHFEIDTFRSTYAFIVLLITVLLAYIHLLTLLPPLGYPIRIERAMIGGMMLFFILLGNELGKVQRNFFVGVRTPWTLASDRVWTETHRLAAHLSVATGVLGLLSILSGLPYYFPLILFGGAAVTIIGFSLVRYKQLERRGEL